MTDFQLIDSGWSRVFVEAIDADNSDIQIICPFIKLGAAKRLLAHGRPKSLRVITRLDLNSFNDGVSDISALQIMQANGGQIRGVKNLHAKVYIFGESRVIVTSANLTQAAMLKNHEFGFSSSDPDLVSTCKEYFEHLWNQAGPSRTPADLLNWGEQVLKVRLGGSKPTDRPLLQDFGVNVGMANPPGLEQPLVADANQAFVKFFGSTDSRAERSMSVLEEVERSGGHWAVTYPRNRRPRQVRDGDIIYMGRMVRDRDDILIFGRAIGMQHKEGRDDATTEEIGLRPWKERWPRYIRVHHAEFLAGSLSNGVSLYALMDELKHNAFSSTQQHFREGGKLNLSPYKAIREKPGMRLTQEGRNWLQTRLETALSIHGKLTQGELENLDWPENVELEIPSGD